MDNSGSSLVVVSSSSHHEKLVSGLWNFFLTNHAVDFEVQWNGRMVRTHRMLLDIFLSPDKLLVATAGQQTIQQQPDCSLGALLEFMYNGTVTISQERLENLLDIAKRSEFNLLVEALASPTACSVEDKNAKTNSRQAKRKKRKIKCIQKLVTYSDDELEFDQVSLDPNASTNSKRLLRSATSNKQPSSKLVDAADSDIDDSYSIEIESDLANVDIDELIRTQSGASTFDTFNCQQCSYTTNREDRLRAHLKSSHSVDSKSPKRARTYRCKQCQFKSRSEHRLKVHGAEHDSSIIVYKCQWCPRKFLDSEKLAKHKCTRLGGANLPKCPHCEFRSNDQRKFRLHVARHDPNAKIFSCKCDMKYADEESLNRHRCKWKNPDAKLFQCPHCPFTNKLKSQLGYHIKGMHSGTKPFKCEEPGCDYACSLKVSLGTHVKVVHQGQKPFVCEKCAYRTYTQSRLKKHLLVHSDERPYKCNECDRSYRDAKTLKDHVSRSHGEDDRNYVCHLCGTAFRRRDTLKTHLRCVHKTQLPKPVYVPGRKPNAMNAAN